MHRENNYLGAAEALAHLAGHLQTAEAGHEQIHQQNIGFALLDEANGFQTVSSFGDDFKIFLRGQNGPQAFTQDAVIVSEDDFNAHGAGS